MAKASYGSGIRTDFMKYFIFNAKCYAFIVLSLFSFCTLISFMAMFVYNSGVMYIYDIAHYAG